MTANDVIRFWSKIDKSSTCWVWVAPARAGAGYGYFFMGHPAKMEYAHRIGWILANGPIPNGQSVLHKCDNKLCVRPDHLFLGTQGDNIHDAVEKGRNCYGERHGKARLTEPEVLDIRQRYAAGETVRQLATSLGMSVSHIGSIVHFRFWKHLKP